MSHRRFSILASFLLAIAVTPAGAQAQEYPRDAVDEAIDQLATDRAQALNAAYYTYETRLEDARTEAEHAERPEVYETRRAEYRADLEASVVRIEREYEQRRADILYGEAGVRPEIREVAGRFDNPVDVSPTAERNDELALAWANYNRAAEQVQATARRTGDWSDYEAAITRLENEYEETIAAIERRDRELRFQQMRERYRRPGDQ